VILYELTSESKLHIQNEAKLIYLNGSRAKEFTLIYESDPKNGLYTSFGFTSKFTTSIYNE
jgi:hypothetical protein